MRTVRLLTAGGCESRGVQRVCVQGVCVQGVYVQGRCVCPGCVVIGGVHPRTQKQTPSIEQNDRQV